MASAVPVPSRDDARNGAGFPVASELESLLPGGRLRPGSAVSVGQDLPLLLALAAPAAAEAGAWAVVGLPQLGVLAADSMGLNVGTGLWVDRPGTRWPDVVATLAEAVPVLLLGPLLGRLGKAAIAPPTGPSRTPRTAPNSKERAHDRRILELLRVIQLAPTRYSRRVNVADEIRAECLDSGDDIAVHDLAVIHVVEQLEVRIVDLLHQHLSGRQRR